MIIDLLVIHVSSCYISSQGVLNSIWNTLQLLIFSHIYILFPHLSGKLIEGRDRDLCFCPQFTSPRVPCTWKPLSKQLMQLICHGGWEWSVLFTRRVLVAQRRAGSASGVLHVMWEGRLFFLRWGCRQRLTLLVEDCYFKKKVKVSPYLWTSIMVSLIRKNNITGHAALK